MTPDLPPPPPEAAPPAAIIVAAPQMRPIVVTSHDFTYSVTGNSLLPEDVVIASLESGTDPRSALDALHKAYVGAGYFLATLVANVADKEVAIKVVQGRISDLNASPEVGRFFESVRNRDDVNRTDLIREAAMADAYAQRQGVRAQIKFEPGTEYGGSKLSVTETPIETAKSWNAVAAFNNYGNRYSSRYVAQATGALRPGGGLELTAGYVQGIPGLSQESKGSTFNSGTFGMSLVTPLGVYSFSHNQTRYQYGEIVSLFHPEGDVSTTTLSGIQLLYADETTRVGLNESLAHYHNQVLINGDFPLNDQDFDAVSIGANFNKGYSIAGLPGSVAATLTLSKGVSTRGGSFTSVQPGSSTPRYGLAQASLSLTQGLPKGFGLGLSVSGQATDITQYERLPSQAQWVMGGYGNLTAWYPGVVSGDSGYLTRLVASSPPINFWEMSLTPTIFAEAGSSRTSYKYPNVPNSYFMSDYGVGLTGTAFRRGTVNLAYAWPWRTRDVGPQVVDGSRAGLFFNVAMSF